MPVGQRESPQESKQSCPSASQNEPDDDVFLPSSTTLVSINGCYNNPLSGLGGDEKLPNQCVQSHCPLL